MSKHNQKAKQDLQGLRRWASKLLGLSDEIGNIRYSENDHFGFMALSFLGKQREHMKSILILNESPDVVLIARSMIEGLCQLLWAVKDPDILGLQWRVYSFIQDCRTIQTKIAAGESVDEESRARNEEGLRLYGDQFLTREARKKSDKGDPLPKDPYRKNWMKHQVRQICEKVEGELLYEHLYRPFSGYHHWDPAGLGIAIKREQNRLLYSSNSIEYAASALAVGFQCLLQMLEVVDRHLELGVASRIAELREGYIAWHQAQRSSQM